MIETPLRSKVQYIALSYSWGPATSRIDPTTAIFTQEPRCYPVRCNGALLLVTRNLRDALRRLRQNLYDFTFAYRTGSCTIGVRKGFLREVEYIWIDALCTDQNNLEERSHQVKIMRHIYSNALKTFAWLGEEDQHTQSARVDPILTKMMNMPKQHFPRLESAQSPHRDVSEEKMISLGEPIFTKTVNPRRPHSHKLESTQPQSLHRSLSEEEKISLSSLLCRNWFTRFWIVQEAMLSKEVKVIIGRTSFPLPLLEKFWAGFQFSPGHALRSLTLGEALALPDAWQKCLAAVGILGMLWRHRRSDLRADLPDFMTVIGICKFSQCQDPETGSTVSWASVASSTTPSRSSRGSSRTTIGQSETCTLRRLPR